MIKDLMELNDFVISFCNYVVRYACENTTSGNYFVDIDDVLKNVGGSYEDFFAYKDLIISELSSRNELLDFDFDGKSGELDLNCGLSYCPNYEWCEGDEAIFERSYEEWLEKPTEPIIDRPTYSQLMDTNYAQSVAPSVFFYVGDGKDIDKDFASLNEALEAFDSYLSEGKSICLGYVLNNDAHLLLDNANNSINLSASLKAIEDEYGDTVRAYVAEKIPLNDLLVGKWRVHVLAPGDHYGLNNCLEFEDKDSCVEFWDMSLDKSRFPEGQFTGGRYYISTLLDDRWGAGPDELMRCGLRLDGDIPAWSVSGDEMKQVFGWLKQRELLAGEHYIEVSGEVDVPYGFDIEKLGSLACVKDLNVEQMGVYNGGTGYTFSFKTQAEQPQVERILAKALDGMKYEATYDAKKVEVTKEPLDKVINKCAVISQKESGSGEFYKGKKHGPEL